MRQINVAIIDANNRDRDFLKNLLSKSRSLVSVFSSSSFKSLIGFQNKFNPIDIVLFDIKDHIESDFQNIISIINSVLPDSKIIIFSRIMDENIIIKCLQTTVNGYLTKDLSGVELEKYLLATTKGEAAISPNIGKILIQKISFEKELSSISIKGLSFRQKNIISFLADGFTNSEIANHLNITLDGVQYHINKIYKELEVKNRNELIKKHIMDTPKEFQPVNY